MRVNTRHLVPATVVLALAVGAGGSAEAARTVPAAGISVAAWQPERHGAAVWRGSRTSLKEIRFLRGALLPTLSPEGRSIAFVRRSRGGFDLFLTGTHAGFEQPLARLARTRTTALAFTPDGRSVAFAFADGIGLASIVPGAPLRRIPLPARWRGSTLRGLAFSPDGRLLAFSRTWGDGRAGTLRNELAIIRRDGGGARSLVRNSDPFGAQYSPTFSPDGARIVFSSVDGSLATVASTGGPPVRLTPPRPAGSTRVDFKPVYSRDGSLIAFTRAPGRGGSDVFLVRPDGRGLRQLTTTPLPAEPGMPRVGSSALAWSPDGAALLAFRHDHLAVLDAATGESTPLATVGVQYEVGPAMWH